MYRFLSNVFCNNFLGLIIIYIFITLFSEAHSDTKILEDINKLHTNLLKITNKEINKDSFRLIKEVVEKTYDSKKMGKMIVGKKWIKLDVKEKEKFILVFEKFIVTNYLRRFSKIVKLDFDHIKIKVIGKKFRLAKFLLKADNEIIKLDYLLHKKDEKWKIIDVLIDGSISEIATKKSDFKKIINEKGIAGLISNLELRNNF